MADRPDHTISIMIRPGSAGGMRQRGSALLLVLFTIILLTGLVTAAVEFVKDDVDEYGALNKEFRARQLAQSGLAFGLNPQVQNEDRTLLQQELKDGGRFDVVIASESTRLNINAVLQSNRNDLLEKLFSQWGVEPKPAKAAVLGLRKYLSGPVSSDQAQAQAQQQFQNQQLIQSNQTAQLIPLGKQFKAVQEMSLVPEFAPVMAKQPNWPDYFTIWGDGRIDVNLADADMIALVTGISTAQADKFVRYRWGPDGKPFTQDDRIYQSMEEVRGGLGMSAEQFQLVQDLLSLNSGVDRIESTGIIAGYQKVIKVIAARNSVPIRYLSWQEK